MSRWLLPGLTILFLLAAGQVAHAQGEMVWSTSVQGMLNRQFARHYLRLVPFDKRQPLQLELEYVPQGRWELDTATDFFVVDDVGLQAVLDGVNPGTVAIAAGTDLPGFPRTLRATILTPDDDQYHIIVVNNSPLPMGYTLTSSNGEIIDDSGRQVVDRWRLPIGAPGSDSPFPLVIVPPQPVAPPPPTPTPVAVRGQALHNRLQSKLDTDYYELFVIDTGQPVTLTMTYDPPEQIHLPEGLNFYVFDDDQARRQVVNFLTPHLAPNTAAGKLRITPDQRFIWQEEIVTPAPHYTVVVSQYRYPLIVSYRLSAQNGILVDRTGTAQKVIDPVPSPGVAVGKSYTIRPGDTLAGIARQAYGDGTLGFALCVVNGLPDCHRIQPGTVLRIPPAENLPRLLENRTPPAPAHSQGLAAPTLFGLPAPTGPVLADNLFDALAQEPTLQTFFFVLEPADELEELLLRDGPYTVLAPVESAFDAIAPAQFDALLDEANPPVEILQAHILQGRLTTERIRGVKQFRTLAGGLVRFERLPGGKLTVNGVPVNETGIPADNGVIYAIDGLLAGAGDSR